MPPRKHAILSASSANRWLACPPSALLNAELPETTSDAAEEGTAAHALAEHKLLKALGMKTRRPRKNKWHDADMDEHTNDYAEFVLETLRDCQTVCPSAHPMIEQQLDFSKWVPDGFGTGDCVIVSEPDLWVIDFKYGKGVEVNSEGNPQMMLYALGAIDIYSALYDVEGVNMAIFQPRLGSISIAHMTRAELETWAEQTLKPTAELAISGGGEYAAGKWCQFCKIGATCRARAEKNLELARMDFKPAPELSDAEIATVLTRIGELKKWSEKVEGYALDSAMKGKVFPGFKLVEGRSIRKITDDTEAAKRLTAAGLTEAEIYTKKLAGLTAFQKLLGKERMNRVIGELITKPAGKPVLVPESDKRPPMALNTPETDFQPINQ